MSSPSKIRGFTLIELLVVIAIIGVLSAVVLASVNSARTQSLAAKTASDLKQIEKSLQLMGDDYKIQTWWTEAGIPGGSGGANPTIRSLLDAGDPLAKYLPTASIPVPPAGQGGDYSYDNDVDVLGLCNSGTAGRGVNIVISSSNGTFFSALDNLIDKGDGADCGKIMMTGTQSSATIIFNISRNNSF